MPDFTAGRKKIGKEIWVFKNEKYGREVFLYRDIRVELLSMFFLLVAVFSFSMEVTFFEQMVPALSVLLEKNETYT